MGVIRLRSASGVTKWELCSAPGRRGYRDDNEDVIAPKYCKLEACVTFFRAGATMRCFTSYARGGAATVAKFTDKLFLY